MRYIILALALLCLCGVAQGAPAWYKISFSGADMFGYSASVASLADQDAPRRVRFWSDDEITGAFWTDADADSDGVNDFAEWAAGNLSGFGFSYFNLWGATIAADYWDQPYHAVPDLGDGAYGAGSWRNMTVNGATVASGMGNQPYWTGGIVLANQSYNPGSYAYPVWRTPVGTQLTIADGATRFTVEVLIENPESAFEPDGRLRVWFGGFNVPQNTPGLAQELSGIILVPINQLSLDPDAASLYIKPGESILVDMNVKGLQQKVNACQAMLGYSSAYFADPTGGCITAGGGPWDELIWDSWRDSTGTPGEIDTAIGVNASGAVGTDADGTVAKIALTAKLGVEGTTQLVFRPDISDVESTFLSDMAGQAVWPAKSDSQTITIDGTTPTDVAIVANPASWTKDNTVALTFSANDALAGIDHYELSLNGGAYFTADSPYNWDVSALPTGQYSATVKAIDRAGNEATASTTVYIDKTAPVVTIPADATVTAAQYEIIASATDADSGIASFTMNGEAFTGSKTVVLAPGLNTFEFVATDNAVTGGNVTTRTLTVTYNQPAPAISVFRSIGPNKYGSSSWQPWLANAIAGAIDGGSEQGDGYAKFMDFGNADQDFASMMVTSSNSWLGIAGGTELGTGIYFVWRIDNGVQANPGAAKLDVRNIAIDFKEFAIGADYAADDQTTDYSSWWNANASSAHFGDGPYTNGFTSALRGFNWNGESWVPAANGATQADLIIYGWFRYAYAPENNPSPVTQDVTNNLYKQLAGSVAFSGEPRRSIDRVELEVKYQGQPNVADGTSGAVVTRFDSADVTKPVITFTSPADGLETNVASQTIAGTVTDNENLASGVREVKVFLNGTQVGSDYTTSDPVSFSEAVTLVEGDNEIRVDAKDFAGNTESSTIHVLLDTAKPVISISDDFGTDPVLQGTYTVTVTASDDSSGLASAPVMNWDGLTASAGTEGPAGTWTYTVTIDAATANGAHTITADISDQAGNAAVQATRTINVNKNQITGHVQLEGYVGTSRVVTFVATGGSSTRTWDFLATGHITEFTLTNVPEGTTHLSAKTNWSLRKKLAVSGGTNGQWTAEFTGTEPSQSQPIGTGNYLRGGDIDNSNSVTILDYSRLKTKWGPNYDALADIDGDGAVGTRDYSIMKANWFKTGDQP